MSIIFQTIQNFNMIPHQQNVVLKEVITFRDHLLEKLLKGLQVNRILINNSINYNSSFDKKCPSSFTKFTEQSSMIQSEQQTEQQSGCKNKKISKNKTDKKQIQGNDTKSIPKNYGISILSFIQKSPKTRKLVAEMGVSYSDFMMQVRRSKKKINSIEGLKRMWGYDNLDHKIKKCIRILSYEYMRKHCLQHVFNSKVRNHKVFIKYRIKLIEGIENPAAFNNIKDY